MKKLSIIIPSYNASKFIIENLKELCDKKYETDIDVFIIDDGSTDNTREIVEKYIENYHFIQYIYQNNSGAPAARNNGLERCNSKYILFLDADDKINKTALEEVLNILNKEEYDLINANFDIIDENGKYINTNNEYTKNEIIKNEEIIKHINDDPKPGAKIYNKRIIKKYNIYFDNLKIGQDLNFYMKMIGVAKKMLLCNFSLYSYRIVNGSISRTYNLKILQIKDSFNKSIDFYKQNNIYDKSEDYIEVVKMCRYYSQFCKLRYCKNRAERIAIFDFFKKEFYNLKINKKNELFKINASTYYKFKIRLLFKILFTSNLYRNVYILLNGRFHKK